MKSYYKYTTILFRNASGSPLDVYEDDEVLCIRGLTRKGNRFMKEAYCYNKESMSFCGPVCLDYKINATYPIYKNFPLNSFYRLVEVGLFSYLQDNKRYWK